MVCVGMRVVYIAAGKGGVEVLGWGDSSAWLELPCKWYLPIHLCEHLWLSARSAVARVGGNQHQEAAHRTHTHARPGAVR